MQAIGYQPSIILQTNTLLMSIRMSMTMSNTNNEAVKTPSAPLAASAPAQTTSLTGESPKINQAPASTIPVATLEDDIDVSSNNANLLSHRKNQIKRLLTETWLRVVLIIGLGLAIFFIIFLFKSTSTDPIVEEAGERSTSLSLSNTPDGSDNLNPAQAQYLMELQRQEAAAKANSGETNAPSLVLPKATVAGVDSNAVSDASAFTVGRTQSYYDRGNGEAPAAAISLTSSGRFSTVGASQLDENANQLAIERNRTPAPLEQPGTDPALRSQSTATYNTNQNSNNGGDYNNGDYNSGNNAGNNGDGSAASAPAEQVRERQPDPDLPIVQQRLYDSYNQQMQELQAQEQRMAEMQAFNQQQAAQLRQQRQQQAAQAIAGQMQNQAKNQGKGGFTSKKYSAPAKQENSDRNNSNQGGQGNQGSQNSQTSGYWERAPDPQSGFQPSSYSSNSAYGNQGRTSNQNETARPPALLAKNIIRAGTRWPVVITKQVNTDEGLSVSGVIVGGPFDGAVVHGRVQPSGRNIGVLFDRIEPANPRKPIIPLNALAQTIGGQKEAVASKINKHHFQNYSVMALESAIGGYGEAYSDSNETVVTGPNGVIIQSKGETTQKEVTAEILKEFSQKLNADIGSLGNRPPTYIINQGSVLHMVLLSNLDIYGTAEGGENRPMPLQPEPRTQQQPSSTGRSSL